MLPAFLLHKHCYQYLNQVYVDEHSSAFLYINGLYAL